MQRRLLSILAVCSSFAAPLLAAAPAHAQGWLADRKYAEGIGIKAGDFEIHPGIGGEAGFDSNWFQRTYNDGFVNSNPVPAGVFRLTGSLYISTITAQRKESDQNAAPPTVNFRLGADVTQRFFVGDSDVVNQNGIDGFSADLNGRLDILPQRPLSFGLQAGYVRTINPNATGNPDDSFNRNTLNVGADFTIRPGGGTFDWKFGYLGNFAFFDNSAVTPFNNFQNSITTRGTWKFSPKTAVIYDGNFSFITYTQQSQAFNGLLDSTPIRSRLGLNGLIGSRFGLSAFAGYGGSFVQSDNPLVQQYGFGYKDKSFPGIIGSLEGKFFLTPNPNSDPGAATLAVSALSIGYNRDFAQSYLGSFYGSDRGYLKFSFFFGGRALISIEGGAGAREYPNIFSNQSATPIHTDFTDAALDATLFGEYRFTNTLGLNATLRYTEEISSTSLPSDSQGDLYHMAFRRFEAYLGFRWFM